MSSSALPLGTAAELRATRAQSGDLVTIVLPLFDSGCLPSVLRGAIAEQQRHMAICGGLYSAEDREMGELYLEQLRSCLGAVEQARRGKSSGGNV